MENNNLVLVIHSLCEASDVLHAMKDRYSFFYSIFGLKQVTTPFTSQLFCRETNELYMDFP